MAWSQHNRNDSEYLHPFGRKQQAVFCQCHHRNPTRNVKISEQKNCSEIKKMVPLTGLEPVLNRFRWILSPLCLPFHHSGVFNLFKWRDMKLEGCFGGMFWRDAPKQRKEKVKKLAVCKHFSDWVLHPACGILSPLCLPVPPWRHVDGVSRLWDLSYHKIAGPSRSLHLVQGAGEGLQAVVEKPFHLFPV